VSKHLDRAAFLAEQSESRAHGAQV